MSQYSLIVPGLYCGGLVRRLCHNKKFCIVTVDWTAGRAAGRTGRRWASGCMRRRSAGARRQLGRQVLGRERTCGRERASGRAEPRRAGGSARCRRSRRGREGRWA